MPKQVLKIDRFEGGINNNSDPRDIVDNELAACEDAMVDEVGRITLMGSFINHEANPDGPAIQDEYSTTCTILSSGESNKGTGLISYSLDYQMYDYSDGDIYINDADKTLEVATNYISLYDTTGGAHVGTFQKEAFGSNKCWNTSTTAANLIDLGGAGAYLSMYFVKGGLRVCDALNGADNVPKWRGLIKPKTYGLFVDTWTSETGILSITADPSMTAKVNVPLVYTTDAAIVPCFPEDGYEGDYLGEERVCINAIMANCKDTTSAHDAHGFAFADETCENGSAVDSAAGTTNMFWGFGIEFDEGVDDSGSWMPDSGTRYKFHVTTVYDDGTQESLPQLMQMYPTESLHATGNTALAADTPKLEMKFSDGTATHNTTGDMVSVSFKPYIKCNGAHHGAVEHSVTHATDPDDFPNNHNFNFGSATAATRTNTGNKRISGVRVYWSSNEDGHSQLWRLMDCDMSKGVKVYGAQSTTGASSGYSDWRAGTRHQSSPGDKGYFYMTSPSKHNDDTNVVKHPPKYLSYFTANGHSHTDEITLESYKTGVIVGQRAYVGNVKQKMVVGDLKVGQVVHYGDRLMKSPVGQYDKFPSSQYIDVVTEDGEAINHLATFADRLLQFKDKTLYIINVSKGQEYLETQHRGLGVKNGCQVATTDIGVGWANKNGVYFYNGGKVVNLFEKNGQEVISKASWDAFTNSGTHTPVVGYIPNKKQLLIQQHFDGDSGTHSGEGYIYIYDFTTRSFVKGMAGKAFGTNAGSVTSLSNMINDYDNNLIQAQYGADDTIQQWSNAAVDSANVNILTKDYDFGAPGVRKKIYKVYISYRGDATHVQVQYGINGAAPSSNFYKITSGTDGSSTKANAAAKCIPFDAATNDWLAAELIPGSSVNNIYSFQLKISGDGTNAIDSTFEINDISIVYRIKAVK
tara:strand:- start:4444 stop:7197 length:2754 start_codon:yes stop_codon:yes gene_type:complete